ncbi:MAG: NAD(P)-binding domain-containing protein [Bacteroidetes bacterium]|nr:NAD(P)-binding domain-containing protein [Bacteroidota bacterium]
MKGNTFGFIGGGRATRIVLGGFEKAGKMPREVVVSDTNTEVLNLLKNTYPSIETAHNGNRLAATKDIVFNALHPPAMAEVLKKVKSKLTPQTILISFAPKYTIRKITESLDGFQRIIRMVPNAPSVVNAGYNPITISSVFSEIEKKEVTTLLKILGECPEVEEDKLEAYAILTAMGPTYFWFQFNTLQKLAESFGLSRQEVEVGILKMMTGAVKTMYQSGLTPEEVMDLVLIKPLGEHIEDIENAYKNKLNPLFKKLKS